VFRAFVDVLVLTPSRKHLNGEPSTATPTPQPATNGSTQAWTNGIVNPSDIVNQDSRRWSGSQMSSDPGETGHAPHAICKLLDLETP
jgi:hypothetical protein